MAFRDYQEQKSVELLQRSLKGGRLGHAYLFAGPDLGAIESVARSLAKTLNCQAPARHGALPIDSCEDCVSCRKVDTGNHPDVHWIRPESKSRVIILDQVRELIHEIQLRPNEGAHKIGVIVAADRLNDRAANAFLKTLEEPPAGSVLILLPSEPQQVLETILSRCLRLNFGGGAAARIAPDAREWIEKFSAIASEKHKSLIGRYKVLDSLLQKLGGIRSRIDETLTARSPIEKYSDAEKALVEKWEEELKAGIEAEYRRERFELLAVLQWWLRDVWLRAVRGPGELLTFPDMRGAETVADRITPEQAMENLQTLEDLQWLLQNSNVQEALALEVRLLKLNL